jgi:hypothetical protein
MRSLWKASLFSMLAVTAFAQHGGGHGGGHSGGSHAASSRGISGARAGFSGSNRGRQGFGRFAYIPWWSGYGYPWLGGYGLGDYWDYGYDYPPEAPWATEPAPPQPMPFPVIAQAPPRPIHPEIKEYNPPDTGDSKPFSIALKDGSVRSALAVWTTDDDTLHYIDGEGHPGQTPLDAVDRAATKKLNDGKNVQSWLP